MAVHGNVWLGADAIADVLVFELVRGILRSGRCDRIESMVHDQKTRRWAWDEVAVPVMDVGGIRAEPLKTRRLRAEVGEYPWDEWQGRARAAGVAEELAVLGRAVIREAYQHGWSAKLQNECGWDDDGEAMIALALREPVGADRRWRWLMETDGERGFLGE